MSQRTDLGQSYIPPSTAVAWVATAGAVGALPYVAMKAYWAWGGTMGKPEHLNIADEFEKNGAPELLVWLERHGIDFTAVGMALGITLLAGLTRPWGQVFPRWVLFLRGRRVPRWLPLTPGWASAAAVGSYGAVGLSQILTGNLGTKHLAGMSPPVFVMGFVGFFSIGVSLGVCSLSYQRRTRPQRTAISPA
ncbi:hypothetical protein [Streptomyces sp. NPDC004284]|uniref:hypothetical protein n=1 Tax=Streptomyces sp. NPDC004284 TaxID=3364695 RepID=UPI003695AD43